MIAESFDTLDPQQMRQALRALQAELARKDEIIQRHERESAFKQATIDKLTHEMGASIPLLTPSCPGGQAIACRRNPVRQ